MKSSHYLSALLVSVVFLANCSKTESISPAEKNKSFEKNAEGAKQMPDPALSARDQEKLKASGKGSIAELGSSFFFHAMQKKDGSIKGLMIYRNPNYEFRGDIDCMTVSGNFLVVGGAITKATENTWLAAGQRFVMSFRDGETGEPDRSGGVATGMGFTCEYPDLATPYTVNGSIVIKQ